MLEAIGTRRDGGNSNRNHTQRLTIPVTIDIDGRIRRMAQRRGISVAALVRRWIEAGLKQEETANTAED